MPQVNKREPAQVQMKKKIVLFMIGSLFLCLTCAAQKKKPVNRKASTKPVANHPETTALPTTSPMIGATVSLITKNGEKLTGELRDISNFSLRLKSGNLESSIALETIASIQFDAIKPVENKTLTPLSNNFLTEASEVYKVFQAMESETRSGSDYTAYGRQLTDLRRSAEKFIQRYSNSENQAEAQIVSLLSGAVIDYAWARTIWTLKLGGNGTVSESDSPVISDTLALYTNLRTVTAVGDRFSADKLIGNLWKKASEKIAKARGLSNQ